MGDVAHPAVGIVGGVPLLDSQVTDLHVGAVVHGQLKLQTVDACARYHNHQAGVSSTESEK